MKLLAWGCCDKTWNCGGEKSSSMSVSVAGGRMGPLCSAWFAVEAHDQLPFYAMSGFHFPQRNSRQPSTSHDLQQHDMTSPSRSIRRLLRLGSLKIEVDSSSCFQVTVYAKITRDCKGVRAESYKYVHEPQTAT